MMERGLSKEWLHSTICDLIDVSRTPQGYEITLPQLYHTGNSVAVVVQVEQGGFLVHDGSYAAMLLESRGIIAGARLQRKISDMVEAYGCELAQLRVQRRCMNMKEIGIAATLVGCASRLIADEVLQADPAPIFDFRRQLLGKVNETIGNERVRQDQEFAGESGSKYKVSAVILDKRLSRPVAFVEAVSDHNAVARRFREFYDLSENNAIGSIERIAVYDDRKIDITSGDVLLLQRVGNAVRFRDSGRRLELLKAA